MNSLELIKTLRKDLSHSKSQFVTIKFFRRNLSSYWVWICILERFFNNKNKSNNNIENIIKEITSGHASRPTLFKIIDDAVKKNI